MFTTKKIIFETTLGKEAEEYMKPPVPSKKIMPEFFLCGGFFSFQEQVIQVL